MLDLGCGTGRVASRSPLAGTRHRARPRPRAAGRADPQGAGPRAGCGHGHGRRALIRAGRRSISCWLPMQLVQLLRRPASAGRCSPAPRAHLRPGGLFALCPARPAWRADRRRVRPAAARHARAATAGSTRASRWRFAASGAVARSPWTGCGGPSRHGARSRRSCPRWSSSWYRPTARTRGARGGPRPGGAARDPGHRRARRQRFRIARRRA